MNVDLLREFLSTFSIGKEAIDNYINEKKIIQVNGNYFLTKEKFEKNKVFDDSLIYIKLVKLLPSRYLLDFIFKNTKNVFRIENEKTALKFTYGKDINEIRAKLKDENYIVTYQDKVLGYGKFDSKNKTLKNSMNVGEYLKEN